MAVPTPGANRVADLLPYLVKPLSRKPLRHLAGALGVVALLARQSQSLDLLATSRPFFWGKRKHTHHPLKVDFLEVDHHQGGGKQCFPGFG